MIINNAIQSRGALSPQKLPSWTFIGLFKTFCIGLLLLSGKSFAARDLCKQKTMRELCEGNLGIRRINMPQIEDGAREKYLFNKQAQGFDVKCVTISPYKLVPVQSEISRDIVMGMLKSYIKRSFNPCKRPILVAHNGTHHKIIDGHHTATACKLAGGKQNAIVIHEKKNNAVLTELQELSVVRRDLNDMISQSHNSEVKSPVLDEGQSLIASKPKIQKELSSSSGTNKSYLLFNYPGSHSGMFSTLISLLGALDQYAQGKFNGLEVDFGESGIYYDQSYGSNWWSYYFKPLQLGEIVGQKKGVTKLQRWHFSRCAELNFRESQKQIPRDVGHALFKNHFHLVPDIEKEIDDFILKNFQGNYLISIHYRGTDKVDSVNPESTRVKYESMLKSVLDHVKQKKLKDFKVFIATDEQSFVAFMKERFTDKIITTNAIRSSNGKPLHLNAKAPYKSGKEALIDSILLASGDLLIRTSSNLSLFSTFINPHMPVIDVSKRNPTPHSQNMFASIDRQNDNSFEC